MRRSSGERVPESSWSNSPSSFTDLSPSDQRTARTKYWGYVRPHGANNSAYALVVARVAEYKEKQTISSTIDMVNMVAHNLVAHNIYS